MAYLRLLHYKIAAPTGGGPGGPGRRLVCRLKQLHLQLHSLLHLLQNLGQFWLPSLLQLLLFLKTRQVLMPRLPASFVTNHVAYGYHYQFLRHTIHIKSLRYHRKSVLKKRVKCRPEIPSSLSRGVCSFEYICRALYFRFPKYESSFTAPTSIPSKDSTIKESSQSTRVSES